MENASKALLIAAGILIAILIISFATRIFTSASGVTKTYYSEQQIDELNTFNANFTRFIGAVKSNGEKQYYATIHDIISVANFAKNYNSNIDIIDVNDPRVLHVNIKTSDGQNKYSDLQNYDDSTYYNLIDKWYYVDNTNPNANNIITFNIDIKYNEEGRANNLTFQANNYLNDY